METYIIMRGSRPLPAHTYEVMFSEGEYLILSSSGGLSRLAFDKLEDQAFGTVLTVTYEWEYSGAPIAEILLNGNPTDAEARYGCQYKSEMPGKLATVFNTRSSVCTAV